MSAVKGVVRTKVDAGTVKNQITPGKEGVVKCVSDSYTFDSTITAGSTIAMCPHLPEGARIKEVIVHNSAMNSSVTFAVGDSDDADRYIGAYDANGTTRKEMDAIGGNDYVIGTNDGDEAILITTAGASVTATKYVEISVFYVL